MAVLCSTLRATLLLSSLTVRQQFAEDGLDNTAGYGAITNGSKLRDFEKQEGYQMYQHELTIASS